MANDQDDFGPIFVPARVPSWLSRLSGRRTPEAAPAGDEEAAPLQAKSAAAADYRSPPRRWGWDGATGATFRQLSDRSVRRRHGTSQRRG